MSKSVFILCAILFFCCHVGADTATDITVSSSAYDFANKSGVTFFGWQPILAPANVVVLTFTAQAQSDLCIGFLSAIGKYVDIHVGMDGNKKSSIVDRVFTSSGSSSGTSVPISSTSGSTMIIPDTSKPVLYTAIIAPGSNDSVSLFTLTGKTQSGAASTIISCESNSFKKTFSSYSFRGYGSSFIIKNSSVTFLLPIPMMTDTLGVKNYIAQLMSATLTQQSVLDAFQQVFQPLFVKPGKTAADWKLAYDAFVLFVTKASSDASAWAAPFLDVVMDDQISDRISLKDYAIRLLNYVGDRFSLAPADVKSAALAAVQMLSGVGQPASGVASTSGAVVLTTADYMSKLALLAQPSGASDLDGAMGLFAAAFDFSRSSSTDLARVVGYLGTYCQQASGIPEWSSPVNGTFVKGVSPRDYVKTLLSTVLMLNVRYSGVTAEIKTSINTLIGGPSFVAMAGLLKGSVGIFKLPVNSCLSVESAGVVVKKSFVNACEPSTHFWVSAVDASTGEIQLKAGNKSVVSLSGVFSCADGVAVKLKFVPDPQGAGYVFVDARNKQLRWQDGAVFGDVGTPASFSLISPTQTVLDGLTGALANDLMVFDKAVQAVKDNSGDLVFIISLMGAYIANAAARGEWTTAVGVDPKNPLISAKDYAIAILNKVRDGSWLFTGLTAAIVKQIEDVLVVAKDPAAFYVAQMNLLDGMANALVAPADVVLASTLTSALGRLVPSIVENGTPAHRALLLSKIDSYYDPKNVPGLAQVPPGDQKKAWLTALFGLAVKILNFDASTLDLWDEKLGYVKDVLVLRLDQFDVSTQLQVLPGLMSPYLKKLATEFKAQGLAGPRRLKLRQLLNDLDFQIQQIEGDQSIFKGLSKEMWDASGINAVASDGLLDSTTSTTPATTITSTPTITTTFIRPRFVLKSSNAPREGMLGRAQPVDVRAGVVSLSSVSPAMGAATVAISPSDARTSVVLQSSGARYEI